MTSAQDRRPGDDDRPALEAGAATVPGAAPHAARGLGAVMIATLVAGGAGYVIQGVVPAFIGGPADYLPFAAFWSALYLVIAALSGVQQEITRAAAPLEEGSPAGSGTLGRFLPAAAVVVAAVLAAVGIVAAPALFGPGWVVQLVPMVLGATAYVGIAVLSGVLYGLSMWWAVACTTIVDAVLRMVAVLLVSFLAPELDLYVWAVALPFPLTAIIMWCVVRRRVTGAYRVDVPPGRLARNALTTVVAAIATGILTSGFSAIVTATTPGQPAAVVGTVVFVLTLTRAPLVIPMLALQSFLTVQFRDRADRAVALMLRLLALAAGVGAIGSVAAAFVVPPVIALLWPQYAVGPWMALGTVLSAASTAMLCVSGPAVLARSLHRPFVAGWVVAALLFVGGMLVPLPIVPRILLALGIGPVVGVIVHVLAVVRARSTAAGAAVPTMPERGGLSPDDADER